MSRLKISGYIRLVSDPIEECTHKNVLIDLFDQQLMAVD